MTIFLGFLAAISSAAFLAAVSLAIADGLFPKAGVSVKLAAAGCLGYWTLAWGFEGLALAGVFRLPVVLLLVLITAAMSLVRWRGQISQVVIQMCAAGREEITQLFAELRESKWIGLGLGAVYLHLLVRMLRTLATPAFGWDDFTYHLFRAGRWIQNSGFSLDPAPDAWTYYEFFPWGGDLLWAWGMLWGVGDSLVPVTAVLVWCGVVALGYAGVRELGQSRLTALILATGIAVLPSQAGQMATAYVDNAVLAMVLGASLFLLILLRSQDSGSSSPAAFLVGVCLGLGLLVKMSFLPLILPALLIVAWRSIASRRWRDILVFSFGLAVAVPNMAINWILRGSPFYPFEIVDSFPFNQQHSWILSKYGEGATAAELLRAGKALVVNLFELDPFLNLGILGTVLIGLGLIGSFSLARSTRGRWFLLWAAVGAILTLMSFFSPRNSSMVVWWTLMMGRFLVPSLAGLMLVGGLVSPLLLQRLLVPTLVVEYFVYARRGWPPEQTLATIQVAALLALLALMTVLLVRWRRPLALSGSVIIVATSLVFLSIVGVREGYRYDAYRLFAERRLLDFHGAPPASAWPIWKKLDETGPQRVAATAGFDGLTGHNWFRGPLLGAWLQNEVLYVPVTRDGELVSYRDREALVEAADREAWLTRLGEEKVDRVAALGPANIEHRWMLDLPEIFDIEISMAHDHFLLARIDHQALARHLDSH